jgi:hypothetical protein
MAVEIAGTSPAMMPRVGMITFLRGHSGAVRSTEAGTQTTLPLAPQPGFRVRAKARAPE